MKWALLLLFFTVQTFAQNCATKNLLTEPHSPFNHIPVYDQDGNGLCYAYSASQLINYRLIKNGPAIKRVHPGWLAYQHALFYKTKTLHTGGVAQAIWVASNLKTCDYHKVASSIQSLVKSTNATEAQILNFIDSFSESYARKPKDFKSYSSIQSSLKEAANVRQCCGQKNWNALLPQLATLKNLSSLAIFASLVMPDCEWDTSFLPPMKEDSKYIAENEFSFFANLNLETAKEPVAITYCANVWTDPDFLGVNRPVNKFKSGCAAHASLVVGKKMIGNSCHYLVRNTWGTQWTNSNSKFKCMCRSLADNKLSDNCTPETHPNSKYSVDSCWLPEKALKKNTLVITKIK